MLRLRHSVLWAATWAIGVALGVALGAWLSVVGAQGAPGAAELDASRELILMPLATGTVVFVGYLAVDSLLALLRRGKGQGPTHA